ncbi:MAG: hypothetical protein FGM52_12295 [Mycobacterium sp.]|nr:hypothetical protein [Mycobacterium sp.]
MWTWTGPYYGLISFGVNTNRVPDPTTTWADLLKPGYKGMVATNGDPRQATSPLNAVWAASLANGGSPDDIAPGIDYFGRLSRQGNYIPLQANVLRRHQQRRTTPECRQALDRVDHQWEGGTDVPRRWRHPGAVLGLRRTGQGARGRPGRPAADR